MTPFISHGFPAIFILLGIAFFGSGCQTEDRAAEEREGPIRAVVTFDVLGNLLEEVAGDKATVSVLVPRGESPREFTPGENTLRTVAEAEILFEAGLGFEPWVEDLYSATGESPRRVSLAHYVTLLQEASDAPGETPPAHTPEHSGRAHSHAGNQEHEDDASDGHEHDEAAGHRHGHGPGEHTHSQYDPAGTADGLDARFWMDVRRVERVANGIRNTLERMDPANAETFRKNASAFADRLLALDERIRDELGSIPEEDRVMVVDANRFQYFAERYNLTVSALLTQGNQTVLSNEELAERLREANVETVFTAYGVKTNKLERAADEAGVSVVKLHAESIGEETAGYIEAMEYNLGAIMASLGSAPVEE